MRIGIVASPAPWPPTGASTYVAGLESGLRALGHEVRRGSTADPGDALTLVDGALLRDLPTLNPSLAVAIVHHPFGGRGDQARVEEAASLRRLRVVATEAETAARLDLPAGQVGVVPAGVPDAPRSGGPGAAAGCDILSVAPLVRRHAQDELLRALARLFDLEWTLTLAGAARDADYAAELTALAAELGVASRVRFVTATDSAGMAAIWDRAGCFARTSRFEARPPLLLEALRRGLPVALAAEGEAATLVPPEAGVVVSPGDGADLSKALRRVVFDGGLRAAMANAAAAFGATLPGWPAQAALLLDTVAGLRVDSG